MNEQYIRSRQQRRHLGSGPDGQEPHVGQRHLARFGLERCQHRRLPADKDELDSRLLLRNELRRVEHRRQGLCAAHGPGKHDVESPLDTRFLKDGCGRLRLRDCGLVTPVVDHFDLLGRYRAVNQNLLEPRG